MKGLDEARLNKIERGALDEFCKRVLAIFNGRIMLIELYGSRARGERHWQSDVDVLVVVRKRTRKFDEKLIDIEMELDEKFNYAGHISSTPMSLVEYSWMVNRQWPFILTVKEDGIELWRNPELKI